MKTLSLFGAFVLIAAPAYAADIAVGVDGAHICCGACVKGINKALGKAKGVSDVKVDKDKKSISFTAADAKAARGGLVALARAGFYGKATVGGKAARFPGRPVKKGTKADTAVVRGPHICCPGCKKSIAAALKGVSGVENVACQKRSVKLTGKDIDVAAAVAALRKAGFAANYGTRKKPKKKSN